MRMERKIQNSQSSRKACGENKGSENKKTVIRRYKMRGELSTASSKISNSENSSFNYLTSQTAIPSQSSHQNVENTQASENNLDKSSVCSECGKHDILKQSYCSSTSTPRFVDEKTADTLKAELWQCKKELADTNHATKELEQKYLQINVELGEMQQRHDRFLADRFTEKSSDSNNVNCSGSEMSVKRKCAEIFEQGNGILLLRGNKIEPINQSESNDFSRQDQTCSNRQQNSIYAMNHCTDQTQAIKCKIKNKDRITTRVKSKYSKDSVSCFETSKDSCNSLNKVYEKIQEAISSERKSNVEPLKGLICDDIMELQKTIGELHKEQSHLCNVIQNQQNYLQDFQCRYVKAKQTMEKQQHEIEKLTLNNKDLQQESEKGIHKLRQQLKTQMSEISSLPQKINETQTRYLRVVKEKQVLTDRIHNLQAQVKELKIKLEDLAKRKMNVVAKLKNAERDLRVYKNYNTALKGERQRQAEEMQKLRERLETQQAASKRMLARQRDINDKSCRELQRRIYDLEQKLGRSTNSTSGLLQQRDRLISELQSQVNTLVHNFEISQKHIRVLRRQIVTAAGANGISTAGIVSQRKNSPV